MWRPRARKLGAAATPAAVAGAQPAALPPQPESPGPEAVHGPAPLSAYHAARWARDQFVEELENRVRYLRGLVFILVATCAIAVSGAVALARQSRIVPYIVEVDRLGEPRAVGRADEMPAPDERSVRREIRRFIMAMRVVVADPVAQSDAINSGYAYTRGAARRYVDAYFSVAANNPQLISRELIRRVDVRSLRRLAGTESTWQVDWNEYEIPIRGGQASATAWRGTLQVAAVPPEDDKQLFDNPIGIYITDVSWAPLSDATPVALQDVRELMTQAAAERVRDAMRAAAPAAPPAKEIR